MKIVILILLWLLALFLQYKLFLTIKKYKYIELYIFVSFLLTVVCFFGSGLIALFLYRFKFEKIRKKTFDYIIKNTDSNAPDTLMKYINSYGIFNEPESWNQLRGVWFAINESSNITSSKKRELRDFLTTKGLRLVGNDKNVIDNYKG